MNLTDNNIAPTLSIASLNSLNRKNIAKNQLPKITDARADVIVIGKKPHTRNYRAFLEKRAAASVHGKSWLFVEHSNFAKDYEYRQRLTQYLRDGVINRVNVAFEQNTTVEDKLLSKSQTVFEWLEGGAEFYVYGDSGSHLSNDIASVLAKIVQENIKGSKEDADVYVKKLKSDGRFFSDIDLELGVF